MWKFIGNDISDKILLLADKQSAGLIEQNIYGILQSKFSVRYFVSQLLLYLVSLM